MTTPICNCPDDIGWLPETSWPLSESAKSNAQSIYCLSGLPKVPPRGGFKAAWPEARVDASAGLPALAVSGDMLNPSGAFAGVAVIVTATITNPYAYPIEMMGSIMVSWFLSGFTDASTAFTLTTKPEINGVDSTQASSSTVFGNPSQGSMRITDSWQMYLGQIAPGASMALRIHPTYVCTGALTGTLGIFNSALRVWGGTVV